MIHSHRSLILIVLFALLLLGAFSLGDEPVAAGSDYDPPSDPFGIYIHDWRNLRGASQMADAGAKWLSVNLLWLDVEEKKGVYDWTIPDRVMQQASEAGFQVILTITGNPKWAADRTCGPVRDLDALVEFVRRVAERYSVPPYNLRHIAMYNEPDNGNPAYDVGGCWGQPDVPPAPRTPGVGGDVYAAMMARVYPAIKAVNPEIQVLNGALAYDWFIYPDDGFFDPFFFDDFIRAGGANYFDILNFHYYQAFAWRWDEDPDFRNPYNEGVINKANYLRQEMINLIGDPSLRNKPIICTELGSPSAGPDSDELDYSEAKQAQDVIKELSRAMSAGLSSPIIWFQAVDQPAWPRKYGLLRADLSPKPAYEVYRLFTREFSNATFVRAHTEFGATAEGYTAEGYEFEVNGRAKHTVWQLVGNGGTLFIKASVRGAIMRVVDMEGNVSYVRDGGPEDPDGEANRFVGIYIDQNPRIVEDMGLNTPTPTFT
ncbi:MAG: cellulase family glycosylhydrolase, partial [Chloroflexi bacterium]|nr:cellulase family glycosylhydrolase [Chloroflexota bacterium]